MRTFPYGPKRADLAHPLTSRRRPPAPVIRRALVTGRRSCRSRPGPDLGRTTAPPSAGAPRNATAGCAVRSTSGTTSWPDSRDVAPVPRTLLRGGRSCWGIACDPARSCVFRWAGERLRLGRGRAAALRPQAHHGGERWTWPASVLRRTPHSLVSMKPIRSWTTTTTDGSGDQ